MKHGTRWTYRHHRCRCADCTEAHRLSCLSYRRRRGDRPIATYQADRRRRAEERRDMFGDFDQARIRHADELELVRATATGDLAPIVAEQARDDRYGHRVYTWLISLDAPDFYGRERYETLVVKA